MEHKHWEKDTTPYLVFACTKCKQYCYVKTTQKTKKCLRCGRTHQVKNILSKGKIVKGMSVAVRQVKELQSSLGEAQFIAYAEFSPAYREAPIIQKSKKTQQNEEKEYQDQFLRLLNDLSAIHSQFPLYMIEVMAHDYNIPSHEITLLVRAALSNKLIVPVINKPSYFVAHF